MPINKSHGPEISKWRRRLERKGWIGLRRSLPPTGEWIEFHVIWKGWLYSGRCRLSDYDQADYWREGSMTYLLYRQQDIVEGVWRRCEPGRAG
ncbi:hypothetical protein [Halomonas elongata]|uniref:hypothetical protein n=1 Tax=Halomonas elongata TaxID=2746 RepID=UPI00186B614D|nr:hypothetical protein [Halomonas elongata]MBW5801203.1 hypothetical protein [Halomonas elongata]